MLKIQKANDSRPSPSWRMILDVLGDYLGGYHNYIFSGTETVKVSIIIKDGDSEKIISIPGGAALVSIYKSAVSIYTEEPATVQPNGSDSKEEPRKK